MYPLHVTNVSFPMLLLHAVAANIGSSFTLIWDVSNATISQGDYSGVLNLAILTTCLSVVPLGNDNTDIPIQWQPILCVTLTFIFFVVLLGE